jgi:RNA polymerase sigma factor (sigma-70 family)
MADPSLHTTQLHAWVDRVRAGDLAARDELLCGVGGRLERLARKMLKSYPTVRRWVETGDVLQNAQLRLLRSLRDVRPDSVRGFFGLAAEQMRRELLDLARHFHGPMGVGANHSSQAAARDGRAPVVDPPDARTDPDDLERWTAFHEGVAVLPTEEREVVGLIFYHGWKQAEVADLFQVTVRTVQRRWQAAMGTLHQRLNGDRQS